MNRKDFFSLISGSSGQKGVSLLITFFIMVIALSIVLGISVIIISELEVIRGIGYSVVAFYSADTGIEKSLYYDRKVKDAEWTRGICNICVSCTTCDRCVKTGVDCAPETCTDCQISYETTLTDKMFRMLITVTPANDIYQSYGSYLGVSRAVELSGSITGEPGPGINTGPSITNASAIPRSVPEGVEIGIIANIYDSAGLNAGSIVAKIQFPDNNTIATISMENFSGNMYAGSWAGPEGVYYVDITACDLLGACTTKENI